MKIQTTDLRMQKEQRDLADKIPLPAPYALYLEPTSLCNMRCAFCPTGDTTLRKMRPNGLMKWEVFTKIVDDIAAWGVKLKRVNLYKDGDPLVHKQFPDMVRYLKDAGVSETLWTKTNGLALNPALNQRLADCGLDMVGISIQAVDAAGYERIAGVRLDYDRFLANIRDLYERRTFHLYIKIADSGLTKFDKDKFAADFAPMCDSWAVEQLHGWSNSEVKDFTLGTNPTTFEGWPLEDKIACPLPFYLLGINWDGTVSLCNEDWRHQTIVGDLRAQTLRDVWEGERLKAMRIMHLEGRRGENVMCAHCNYLRTLPDNLDGRREELLERITHWRDDETK